MPNGSIWQVRLLGGLSAEKCTRVVDRLPSQQTAGIFAYLALRSGAAVSRDHLQDLFWPDEPLDAVRHRLTQALSTLRGLLEAGTERGTHLTTPRGVVRLTGVTTDVACFLESLRAAEESNDDVSAEIRRLTTAIDLYRGELLPGRYDDWCLAERDRLHGLFAGALRRRSTLYEAVNRLDAALGDASLAAQATPTDDATHMRIVELLRVLGRGADALHHLRSQVSTWEARFHEPPPAALVHELRAAAAGSPALSSRRVANLCPATRLPATTDAILGRDREVEQIAGLLATGSRLVTLTGVGGVGKTALALAVAARATGDREHPIEAAWWVDLQDARAPSEIGDRIAAALGMPQQGPQSLARLPLLLGGSEGLLVLDNFEQLCDGGEATIRALLAELPTVRVLVTSRRHLALPEERVVPVTPLSVPPRTETDPAALSSYPAMALFLRHVIRHAPEFRLTAQNAAALRDLAQRLEGLPLALELAASRLHVLSPDHVARQLAQAEPSGDAPEARHGSVPATLLWSLDLLPPSLRRAALWLSSFRGGWSLPGAATVIGDDFAAHTLGILRMHCVIVAMDTGADEPRFRMLEPIRQAAAEMLPREERSGVERSHRTWVASLFSPLACDPRPEGACVRLAVEEENLRAALDRALRPGDGLAEGLRLAADSWAYWNCRGLFAEGRRRLDLAIERGGADAPIEVAAELWRGASMLAWQLGEWTLAEKGLARALRMHRASGNRAGVAACLMGLANVAGDRGDLSRAWRRGSASARIRRRIGDEIGLARVLSNLGRVACLAGRAEEGEACYRELEQLAGRLDDPLLVPAAAIGKAVLAEQRGLLAEAEAALLQAIRPVGTVGERRGVGEILTWLGRIHFRKGDLGSARRCMDDALCVWQELGHRQGIGSCHENLGLLAIAENRLDEARHQLGTSLRLTAWLGNEREIRRLVWLHGLLCLVDGDRLRAVRLLAAGRGDGVELPGRLAPHARRARELAVSARYARQRALGAAAGLDEAVRDALEAP